MVSGNGENAAGPKQQKWYVVDASGKSLGRVASAVAAVLRGKHRPDFCPERDMGDHVIVINASKVVLTGNKATKKVFYRHSQYPGGLKATPYGKLLSEKPDRAMRLAVGGMLPHNRLGRTLIRKLKVYAGSEHPHQAQKPEPMEVKG